MINQKGSPCGEAGQTLLEILLAFSVSILVLSAVILGIVTSLSNTQYTKNQGLANSYAQEGMSVVRKIRDSSLNDYSALGDLISGAKYCIDKNMVLSEVSLAQNCSGEDVYGVGEKGIFSREVKFEHNSSNCCSNNDPAQCDAEVEEKRAGSKATVTVSWADSKCPLGDPLCHKVELITCFSNMDKKLKP